MVLFLRRVRAALISYLISMPTCILYARSATVSNESIERQLTALRAHARLQGWSVVDEVSDNGASGLRGDRPGLLRLLAACKGGEVDIVLVQRLDRLSRSTTLTVELMDALSACGVRLATINHDEAAQRPQIRMMRHIARSISLHQDSQTRRDR